MLQRQTINSTLNKDKVFEKRNRLFNIISECVVPQINILQQTAGGWEGQHANECQKALERLYKAILIKSTLNTRQSYENGQLHIAGIKDNSLDSIDDMLDARFKSWRDEVEGSGESNGSPAQFIDHISLRRALNICPYNLFNIFPFSTFFSGMSFSELIATSLHGTWGPIVSEKTDALLCVEQALSLIDIEPVLNKNHSIHADVSAQGIFGGNAITPLKKNKVSLTNSLPVSDAISSQRL